MKTTIMGRSGLEVSRIAFGTWQLGGGWGQFDEDAAVAAIRRARELGSDYALAKGAAMLNREFIPGFPLRHATKDAELALSAGDHGDDDVASAVLRRLPPPRHLAVG